MHVIEAAGFAIAQDDAALIDRRATSRVLPALRAPAKSLAAAAFYTFVVIVALLSFLRSRVRRASSARVSQRLDRAR